MGPSGDESLALFVARIAFWRAREQALKAILVTGDLATSGLPQDLHRACEYFDSQSMRLWLNSFERPTLRATELPMYLLPGNHDRFKGNTGGPGGAYFDTVFGHYWRCGNGAMAFPILSGEEESLCVVAADFTLRRKRDATRVEGIWGQGKAYLQVIEMLKSETKKLRYGENKVAIIWAFHFPPGLEGDDPNLELIDGDLVLEAAEECKVSHIFAGHIHKIVRPEEGARGSVSVCCAGSATQVKKAQDNSFHEIEILVEEGDIQSVTCDSWIWDTDARKFVEASSFKG